MGEGLGASQILQREVQESYFQRMNSLSIQAVIVWLIMMFAETVHGILRALFLVPIVGDLVSRQIGVPVGSLLILIVAFLFAKWIRAKSFKAQVGIGLFWVFLTVLFEILLGRLILDLPWSRIIKDYDLTNGGFMILGLIVMAFSLTIAEKLHQYLDAA